MLLHAFHVLPLLHHYADGGTSIGEVVLQERVPESLPSSTSLVSVSVVLGMNKSNIMVVKQNWAGQTRVNLMACR